MSMPGYEGWAALGETLGGGSRARQGDAYIKGLGEGYTVQNKMEEAGRSRAMRIAEDLKTAAREKAADAYRAYATVRGLPPEAGELGAVFAQGGNMNFDSFMSGDEQLGDREIDRQRLAALGEGKFAHANQLAAVQNEKAYEPVRALDGNLVPSGVELGDPAFHVQALPQTQARIDQGAQRTHAAVARSNRPPAGRSATSKAPSPEAEELSNAREALQSGIPRATVIAKMRARGYGSLAKKL